MPLEVISVWTACRSARLFEDIEYGQWGLLLLDPVASAVRTASERQRRPRDVQSDDVVLGEFLGDQELLVVAPSEEGERRVLIALPLDDRAAWFGVAPDVGTFLGRYFDRCGTKYWNDAPA